MITREEMMAVLCYHKRAQDYYAACYSACSRREEARAQSVAEARGGVARNAEVRGSVVVMARMRRTVERVNTAVELSECATVMRCYWHDERAHAMMQYNINTVHMMRAFDDDTRDDTSLLSMMRSVIVAVHMMRDARLLY